MDHQYYLETILKNITEGIIIVNREGTITLLNEPVEKIAGIRSEEAIGRNVLEVFPHLQRETSAFYQVLRSGEPLIDHIQTYINSLGKEVTIVTSVVPLKEGEKMVGALEVFRDFTQVEELSRKIGELQERTGNPPGKGSEKSNGTVFVMEDLITEDPEMMKVMETARKVAGSRSPVLVYGETGTGKEILVQAIHNADPQRKDRPFIAQNCAALPKSLLESILFGSTAGSFTDARERKGLFELAHTGTLFLDEINSMDPELQGKILRILEDGVVRRVGGANTTRVDVRIVASTNENPREAVKSGKLREDLYYRLNVIYFSMHPLRERKRDIPLLVNHFISQYNQKLHKRVKRVSDEVLEIFQHHPWEGNVRELKYLIERTMNVIGDKESIEVMDLPEEIGREETGREKNVQEKIKIRDLPEAVKSYEIRLIQEAIEAARGNCAQAARNLGIPKQTLHNKIRKYGITWDVTSGKQ